MPDPIDLGELRLPLLVFGGPYSNLAATEAMRERAEALGIPAERVICTGDLVAYCAEPAQTLDFIREWGIHVVMGNCEESLANDSDDCGCGFEAGSSCSLLSVTWYRYASAEIKAEQRRWMAGLPRRLDFSAAEIRFSVIHGSYRSINEFVFESTDQGMKQQQVKSSAVDCIIGGHSGIPFGQKLGRGFWLNGGVIGMPANDGSADGWYMLLQGEDTVTASWHRLTYDHQRSAHSTINAGMVEYGNALNSGLWPSMDVLPETEKNQQGQPIDLSPLLLA